MNERPSSNRHDGHRPSPDRHPTVKRVTVPEAAAILGVTPDAIRSRLRRGKLRREEGEDGTVYVLLETSHVADGHDGQKTVYDRQETVGRAELIERMASEIDHLRDQLEKEREANRENRRLLAAALERIPPQLEAPSGAREGHETASEEASGIQVPPEPERRSWWRRMFGSWQPPTP